MWTTPRPFGQRRRRGEVVYNQKYDANHWNDLGAYYGTNAILEELQRDFPSVHVNGTADLNMDYELKTSLPVSEFPIHEMVPAFTLKSAVDPAAGNCIKMNWRCIRPIRRSAIM